MIFGKQPKHCAQLEQPFQARNDYAFSFGQKTNMLVSLQYRGRLKVKYMIKRSQLRKDHCDSHYAAAVFRHTREYAVIFREHCLFVCLDDKHRLKVGKPAYPAASAERGRRVLMKKGIVFEVGYHDFTKYSLILSVAFLLTYLMT